MYDTTQEALPLTQALGGQVISILQHHRYIWLKKAKRSNMRGTMINVIA